MNLIPLMLLIVLILLFVKTQPSSNRLVGVVLLVSIVLVLCLQDVKEKFVNYADVNYTMGKCGGFRLNDPNLHTETSTFDPNCNWRKSPCDSPLVSDVKVYSPVGEGIKLTEDEVAYSYPTVDGKKDSAKRLFMFADNQCHPGCCPSTYTCDKGCVCSTKQQRKYINSRGKNRQHPEYFQI